MNVEKQEVYLNNLRSYHGTKLLKSAFDVMSLVWKKTYSMTLSNDKLFQRLAL